MNLHLNPDRHAPRLTSRTCDVLLVPVDGSLGGASAAAHAIAVAGRNDSVIHLLNVQPEIMTGEVSPFIPASAIRAWRTRAAEDAMIDAKLLLDTNRVDYDAHVAFGEPAEEIVRHAARHGCATIIMGTRGRSALASLVLGSVAASVIRLASVPVTLVKHIAGHGPVRPRSRERDVFDSAFDRHVRPVAAPLHGGAA